MAPPTARSWLEEGLAIYRALKKGDSAQDVSDKKKLTEEQIAEFWRSPQHPDGPELAKAA